MASGADDSQTVMGAEQPLGTALAAIVAADPRVAAVRVIVDPDESGVSEPLVCVVPQPAWLDQMRAIDEAEQTEMKVSLWTYVFDSAYAGTQESPSPPSFASWTSSFTGLAFPTADMEAWRDRTVQQIEGLRPNHVLEIGCGLGLILEKIAPACATYRATDISARAIGMLRRWASAFDALRHAEIMVAPAHQPGNVPCESLDTVILNSVVQYFPGLAYLTRVLSAVRPALMQGGRVFIGDVRDVRLLPVFAMAVALARAADADTVGKVRRRMIERPESELAIAPHAFASVPGYGRARLLLKQAGADNELTNYRYDVVLDADASVDASAPLGRVVMWTDSTDGFAAIPLRPPTDTAPLLLQGILNRRLARDMEAARALYAAPSTMRVVDLRAQLAATPGQRAFSWEPAELIAVARQRGHRAEALCSAASDRFDLLLTDPALPRPLYPADFTNDIVPATEPLLADLAAPLLLDLREAIASQRGQEDDFDLVALSVFPPMTGYIAGSRIE